jgi:hypothetical protein
LLFIGVATLFVPVTALQNSIAMAQEYYPEYEENEYYYNQEYDHYQNGNKNAPIVNVEKNYSYVIMQQILQMISNAKVFAKYLMRMISSFRFLQDQIVVNLYYVMMKYVHL